MVSMRRRRTFGRTGPKSRWARRLGDRGEVLQLRVGPPVATRDHASAHPPRIELAQGRASTDEVRELRRPDVRVRPQLEQKDDENIEAAFLVTDESGIRSRWPLELRGEHSPELRYRDPQTVWWRRTGKRDAGGHGEDEREAEGEAREVQEHLLHG